MTRPPWRIGREAPHEPAVAAHGNRRHPAFTFAMTTTLERLDTRLVRVPLGAARGGSGATEVELVIVTVHDGDGATGTGFSYALTGGGHALRAMVDTVVRDAAVGTDLRAWEGTWERVRGLTHRLGRGVALPALSAADIAVWDMRAHREQLPLHRLLGSCRESVEAYGSGRATHRMSTEELVAGSLAYVEEGYRAVKLRAGALGLPEDVARIAAVREAVGDRIAIMVDANERLSYADALWLGRRLARLDVLWLEEPLPSADVEGHARLAAGLDLAIAVGEHLQGRHEFADYLRRGAASIVQPDAPLVGGVTEWCRIAVVAEALGATVTPHFLPELHIHLCLATPACTYVEHFPLIDGVLRETLQAEDGRMRAPDRPGHGMLWDPEALDRHEVSV
jgi:L-alanine-DL-glutamate epimerase-like enolase superfamily enzyme